MSEQRTAWKRKKGWFRKEFPFHVMLLPGVLIVLIFKYIPIVGLKIAFEDYSPVYGFFDQIWVGLGNFRFVFSLPTFTRVIANTVFIAIMKIVANIAFPLLVALLLNELRSLKYKRTLQTIVYLPHFISWIALAGIFVDVLSPQSGIVNGLLGVFGIKPIYFLGDPKVFPYTLVMTDVWKTFGWNTIIYLAAITNVDGNLYEAAYLDGAGRFKQTLYVTLPGIMPFVLLMSVLSIGNILNAGFDQVFNLYSAQVYSTGDIIDTFVYRLGILDVQFGPATAVGFFQSVVSFTLIMLGYYLADRLAGYRVF